MEYTYHWNQTNPWYESDSSYQNVIWTNKEKELLIYGILYIFGQYCVRVYTVSMVYDYLVRNAFPQLPRLSLYQMFVILAFLSLIKHHLL